MMWQDACKSKVNFPKRNQKRMQNLSSWSKGHDTSGLGKVFPHGRWQITVETISHFSQIWIKNCYARPIKSQPNPCKGDTSLSVYFVSEGMFSVFNLQSLLYFFYSLHKTNASSSHWNNSFSFHKNKTQNHRHQMTHQSCHTHTHI